MVTIVDYQSQVHRPPLTPPPHIMDTPLMVDEDMEIWLQNSTLSGEAISLTHLGHLPALMAIHTDIPVNVKYVVGLNAILSFQRSFDGKNLPRKQDQLIKIVQMDSPGRQCKPYIPTAHIN